VQSSRPRWLDLPRGLALATAAVLVAALLLVDRSARGPGAADAWLLPLLLAALTGAVVLAWRAPARRGAWWTLAAVLALLLALEAQPRLAARRSDADWAAAEQAAAREQLQAAVARDRTREAELLRFLETTVTALPADSLAGADPFAVCAAWVQRWNRTGARRDGVGALALGLWAGDQRLGWAGPLIAAEAAPRPDQRRLLHDDRWWVLRRVIPLPGPGDRRLECQLRLAQVLRPEDPQAAGADGVQRTVVHDARAPGLRSWGDAERGLRLVQDVVLGPADAHGVRPRLRLTVQVPPRALQQDRQRAALTLWRELGLGLALVLCGAAALGGAGLWLAAWLARGFWARLDVFRWLAAAIPAGRLPSAPDEPASLLDPAYFATTYGGGWFASSADALVTALLVAGTVAWLWRREHARQAAAAARRPAAAEPVRRWRLLLLLPVVALAVLGLVRLWSEVAANANARLIGLQVPLGAWTFWALHAAILALSLATGALLVLLARRLAGPLPWSRPSAARPVWLAAGLLLLVLGNYAILAGAYDEAERDWLRRKADQIVQPQDDWIGFLIEDVLAEMAAADAAGQGALAVAGSGRGALQRDVPAYRLWQGSAVRDLGLPCLVEILDADGATASLFATGFLRDATYEIVDRGPWWTLGEPGPGAAADQAVLLQDETRRYPTGRERILRGEIPRRDRGGWLRLELPVQSLRIATLFERLAGGEDLRTGGGYRPRLEVDRPLLLLRGDRARWLDTGFGDLPHPADAPLIAALRAGLREWAEVRVGDATWLCRWAPLPPAMASAPGEGFLFGLQQRGTVAILLDLGRLLLLDVLLLAAALLAWWLARRRWRWLPGFQGRFLLGYLAIGVVLLVVAGSLADRQTFQRIDREARERTRDGLVTALGQLRGLLAEQARSLASSDYIAELLTGRLAGERPVGPFAVRQGMVFGPDGDLLLDETLSDLTGAQAATLLQAAREAPLVVIRRPDDLYLGVLIPIDLSEILDRSPATGAFFYRQRVDAQLLPGLAEVVGGELTLRLDGEVFEASHPGRVFAGASPVLAAPGSMAWFAAHPGQPRLQARASGLAFTGGVSLPALTQAAPGRLERRALPAVLAVDFPDRERDYGEQRRRMALFLAGLITLLLVTAFGLAMVLTWNIFEPLRVLLGATRRLAAGDFSAPLPPPGGDEVGRLAAGFRSMRDELQATQQRLAARERFLQAVLDHVPVGVVVWDGSGRLAACNPAADAILARHYRGGADRVARTARLLGELERLPDHHGELVSSDGRRTLRVGLAPVELGDARPHRLAVCEDLSEFLATKKLALNAELARQVAHEIKNPLTPIQLSAQLVQQAYADQHPRRDAIVRDATARILQQVELLRTIAGEFSLLGRPGELECEPLDLAELVGEVVAGYRNAHAAGPEVAIDPAAVPPALAHRESLHKVLGNLMQNSLDAAGGPDRLRVAVSWQVEPAAVTLVWRDSGPGIAADVAGKLFDPYFSTKSKGTGLGLAICRNLLDKMGGTITLANRDDAPGAVATVTLPRAGSEATRPDGDSPTE